MRSMRENINIFTVMKKGILFYLLFFSTLSFSQCHEIHLKGKVVDTSLTNFHKYELIVVNQTTKKATHGQANGYFSLNVNSGDRVGISVKGYSPIFIDVTESTTCSIDTVIYLSPRVQVYDDVVVYRIKSLEEIKKEREELSLKETRTVTGINVLESPITALYERFSKSAKTKRLIAEMEHQDNINNVLKSLLRAYVSYDVVYLEEEEFNDFIYYLNIDEHFLKTSSDYELILYIQKNLENYKLLHPELFLID